MIRRPPRSTPLYSSAASDVYKRQERSRPEPVSVGVREHQGAVLLGAQKRQGEGYRQGQGSRQDGGCEGPASGGRGGDPSSGEDCVPGGRRRGGGYDLGPRGGRAGIPCDAGGEGAGAGRPAPPRV